QKFQQKALKQTKQKKSKSAEFLMVKEDREAIEGFGNPAFSMSNPDLSAHQTSEEKIIRHDTPDRILAAHQQKSRLPVSAELKGNEYSRNYFDPLMDEEINPRQCGMEVSREGELELTLTSFCKRSEIHKQTDEAAPEFIEEWESHAQKDVILLGSSPFEQFLCNSRILPFLQVEQSQSPQLLQIQITCIRGLKDKAPRGSYLLKVSLLSRLGGCDLQCWQTEQLRIRTQPVRHDGNFYSMILCFHESLSMGLPQKKDVKPGMALLFELCLLHGKSACADQAVGWAAFPLCDNSFGIVEGKFKCPLLRGHYEQKLSSFREIEDLICLDLDHWLCNLYFQVVKSPFDHVYNQKLHESPTRLSPEFSVCFTAEAEKANLGMGSPAGSSGKETQKDVQMSMERAAEPLLHASQGSISNKTDPCPTDCDLSLLKEDHELHSKGDSLAYHFMKEKSTACRPGEFEDYSHDTSYLEELEKHRFSVCSGPGPGGLFKHLHFVRMSVFSELQFAQWQSPGFWYTLLLMASLCFLRLCLHYFGQWLFLQAISTPVTKFHLYPYTVELCYQWSSLSIAEELAVIVAGPLMLNAVVFLLVLIRWGCQLLFASCPDVLSKLIITMGLWTVLDPPAVFVVDTFLGRLVHSEEAPTADAAKLYWMFVRSQQSGILGASITVLLYIFLFIISSLIFYMYCLRLHNDSWISDAFQRIHSEETKFFMPYDLEISNQELSYIVKRSEQWRGINGERRKVAVYDYIRRSPGIKSSVSSCDLPHQNEISVSAFGPGDVTSHVSVYTVYPSGFQKLYRHFLRLPSGAIVEVFGDISALQFVPSEVTTAIQEHISGMDTVLRDSCPTHPRDMNGIQ
uniref:Orofacial cleft 1 candidate gene 1 protein n=1 Tax=Cavia porcellus TaxID=10141 RepID=A0A286XZ03_CAVPO